MNIALKLKARDELQRQFAGLFARRAELAADKAQAEKRRAVAFDAHAGDGSASKLLDGLHREAAELESRIIGLDDAVAEARRRLEQAYEYEAREADRAKAVEL